MLSPGISSIELASVIKFRFGTIFVGIKTVAGFGIA
jgi:hypothetical protein